MISFGLKARRAIPPAHNFSSASAFDAAAERLVAASESSTVEAVAPDDYKLVLRTLTGFAQRFGVSRGDAEELASDTIAEAFMRSTTGARRPVDQPAAFLFWTTRNRLIDRSRRRRVREATEAPAEDPGGRTRSRSYSADDDAIVRLLERQATAEVVQDALRAASAADDHLLVRIVSSWINVAGQLGRAPSSREVAPAAEVSHTSVNQALRRFRRYLPNDVREEP
jgi:DNA-directed RNA polymerase specialized sigma24 family protein